VEHFTTKCNVINNDVTILNNRNVGITIKNDPKTNSKQWDGMLYLAGNEPMVFFTSRGKTFGIELKDGRKGEFYATHLGRTVFIKGTGSLK
jgi:hypothetical protein